MISAKFSGLEKVQKEIIPLTTLEKILSRERPG